MTVLQQQSVLDAKHAENAKQYVLAQQLYTQLLAQQPDDREALLGAARVHMQLREWHSAEQIYQHLLQQQPNAVLWSHLAKAQFKQHKTEQAITAWEEAALCYAAVHQQQRLNALGYLNWMRTLIQIERPHDALHVFKLSADQQAELVTHRWFFGLANRLVQQLIEPADMFGLVDFLCQVQRLRPLLEIASEQQDTTAVSLVDILLKTASRHALFRAEVIGLATKIMQQPHGFEGLLGTALDILLCWDQPSAEIVTAYQHLMQHTVEPSLRVLSSYVQVLFVLQRYPELQALGQSYPKLLLFADQQPAMAWLLQQQREFDGLADAITPALRQSADAVLAAYDRMQQQNERVWAHMADPERSIAVVGNSACELGLAKGVEIDAHDTVIRFNAFSLAVPFDQDYGRKVDVQVRSAGTEPNLPLDPVYANKIIVLSYMGFLHRFRRWQLVLELEEQGHQVCCYPAATHHALIRRIGRSPSAGLSVTWILSHLRTATAQTDYYGFAFVDQIGERAVSSHYFEQSAPSPRHDWLAEASIFAEQTGLPPRVVERTPRVRLIGDHSDYHCGCAAVVDYLKAQIAQVAVCVTHDDYDVLVVNGEGSMHHQSINYHKKIKEISRAISSGRPVYLINTVWQNNGIQAQTLMRQVKWIVMRESLSQQDLWQNCHLASEVRIDCSYWAALDPTAPVHDFQNATVVTDFYSQEFEQFVRINGGVYQKYSYVDLKQWQWSSLVSSLKTASLLVTGRHHAMYAACRARTPFVVLTGNTHKIEGLIAMSGLPIPVCQHPKELKAAIAWARKNRAVYDQLFDWMDAQPRLELAEMLLTVQVD